MRTDKTEKEKKKRKKDRESIIEKELMSFLYKSLDRCLNQALDEVLKGFNSK